MSSKSEYREHELRNLTKDLINKDFSTKSNRVVEELGISLGNSRIDIALINQNLTGFEIKSDFDTLKRLPSQIHYYQKYFDRLYLITTSQHLDHAIRIAPTGWGIYIVQEKKETQYLKKIRTAKLNKLIERESLVQLLWKDETISILQEKGLKNLKGKNKFELYSVLSGLFSTKEIKKIVLAVLRNRTMWRAA